MRGRYTRAGSASLHLFKGRWGWLDVSIEGRAWLNVAYLQLEVRDRRARAGSVAPLHPLKGWRGSFAARLGVSIEGRMLVICRVGGVGHCARAGSVAPLHPLKRQRDSFAARLDVSIEGRACWFAFDELDVACLQNRRCVAVTRGRGASLPLHPLKGRRGSFAARLSRFLGGRMKKRSGRLVGRRSERCVFWFFRAVSSCGRGSIPGWRLPATGRPFRRTGGRGHRYGRFGRRFRGGFRRRRDRRGRRSCIR